jgi:predicted 3-demethylubiquinone-9 3-methyltransferase (glyoxalase superfamily)
MRHVLATLAVVLLAGCATTSDRKTRVTPFLMFEGKAEEAMDFYVSLFPEARVVSLSRYGFGEAGPEGTIRQARFAIAGQSVMCIDSPVKHGFTFTPATSLFVDCASEAQLEELFAKLSAGGQVMMPLGNYGFSRRFGWVSDRFGVSWQLNLPGD